MPLTCASVTKCCRSWLVCSCIVGVAVLSGCSHEPFPTGDVSGTVTYGGERIAQGKITFISSTGDFGSATINEGLYIVRAPIGRCKIEIQAQSNENKYAIPPQQMKMAMSKMKQMREKGMKVPDEPLQAAQSTTISFPQKYAFADTSGLEFEVKAGTQTK